MSAFSLKIDIAENRFFNGETSPLFSRQQAQQARGFHQKIAGYKPTPLVQMTQLAALFGVNKILVKDESQRFGLNAFKMLGGAYAIAKLLCEKYHLDINELSFDTLKSSIKEKMTFATTTDGNHGHGIAWAARQLGQHAVIYMPKGSAQERVDAILRLDAECIVTDMNYDDTVRFTLQTAQEKGWEVVQDTAWEGYTKIPTWIMQGYATLADEAVEQMSAMGISRPTHVFLQAGVGAMAGGVLGNPPGNDPRMISGESGAVGLGVLAAVHFHPERQALMHKLKLDSNSIVLVISTEGDTDVKHYREVVWEGKYPAAQ
ncbi:diaminopropionate ammonia-lyase [Salmonella enterica]|nr:diaminopropionate ammonia-lyase [Salmonella enterica]